MSKKNLLNESTIRKFMKLASIEPLASDFIGRIKESEEELDEENKPSPEELKKARAKVKGQLDAMKPGIDKVAGTPATEEERNKIARTKAQAQLDAMKPGIDKVMSTDLDAKMKKALQNEGDEDELDEMGGDMMYKDDDDDMEVGMEMDVEPEAGAAPAGGDMISMDDFIQALEVAVAQVTGEPTEVERDEPMDDMDDMDDDLDAELDAELEDDESLEEEDETLAETIYKQVLKKLSNRR